MEATDKNDKLCELSPLDSLSLDRLDFIKLDVEGHEWNVLQGGVDTISKYKPVIFFECPTTGGTFPIRLVN